ncbi:hypothetical protein C6P45_004882 [Maudiozyma exigua]|uniref:Uncharacterized protein n=1 Tax=Maudiozyma exigua TaxID=34358 RepID=A0A9P7BA26_MAUEX|nr:hypothetical protein C6P45_004882 [Kazachstania exigua]
MLSITSKFTVIFLLLATGMTYPLVKRNAIKLGKTGWYFDLTPTDLSHWAGSVHTVCEKADPLVCLGESVVATVLTGIMAVGNGGVPPVSPADEAAVTTVTVTAVPTATGSSTDNGLVVPGIIHNGVHVITDVAKILNNAGIKLLGLYDPVAADLVKSSEGLVGGIIHFETNIGKHIAAQIGETNFTKLANQISNITPGIPVFKEAENGVKNVVNWVSYTLKETDHDINEIINELENFDVVKIATQVTNFIKGVEDYKFCLSPASSNGTSSTNGAKHLLGEVYFNSYGLLEFECS